MGVTMLLAVAALLFVIVAGILVGKGHKQED